MALRLSLVIEGDASGARRALDQTAKGVGELDERAGAASRSTDDLADATGNAAPAIRTLGEAAPPAAQGVLMLGDQAATAQGKIGRLAGALAGIAGGLVLGALITGFTELASQAARWVGAVLDNEAKARAALEAHGDLIDSIAGKYADAAKGIHDYGEESAAVLRFEAQQSVPATQEAASRELVRALTFDARANRQEVLGIGIAELGDFEEPVRRLLDDIRQGKADVIGFRDEVAAIASALPTADPLREWAEQILSITDRAASLQAGVGRARDALLGLEGDSDAAARALGGLPKPFDDGTAAADRQAKSIARLRGELEALGGTGAAPAAEEQPGFFQRLLPFAAGGIVNRPTVFRFGGAGTLGLMGEAGPEAIMPLAATAQGLAVEAEAGGAAGRLPVARLASGNLGVRVQPFAAGGVIGAVRGSLRGFVGDLRAGAGAVGAFENAVLRLSDQLVDLALDNVLNSLLTPAAGGVPLNLGGGNVLGGVGSFIGQLFGGFRQHGGPLEPGQWYVAGEGGPEAIWGGGPGAFALPAGAPPAAERSVVNNFYVSTPSPRAFVENPGRIARAGARLMRQADRWT